MLQCKVVRSGIAGSAFVVCQAEWPNMAVSQAKWQQQKHQQLRREWDGLGAASEVFAYFVGQVAVFLFRVLPSPGNCLWSLGWRRE